MTFFLLLMVAIVNTGSCRELHPIYRAPADLSIQRAVTVAAITGRTTASYLTMICCLVLETRKSPNERIQGLSTEGEDLTAPLNFPP